MNKPFAFADDNARLPADYIVCLHQWDYVVTREGIINTMGDTLIYTPKPGELEDMHPLAFRDLRFHGVKEGAWS